MSLFGIGRNIKDKAVLYYNPDRSLRLQIIGDASSGVIPLEEMTLSHEARKKFDARRIKELYLNLPLSILSFRILRLPFSDKRRLNEVIPFELQGIIMEGIDDIVFDSVCLGKSDGTPGIKNDGFDILVIYMERNRFASILDNLSRIGLDPAVAGSLEIGYILRETTDPAVIIPLLAGVDHSKSDIRIEERTDLIKEELENPTINLRTGPFEFRGERIRISKAFRMMTALLLMIAILINLDLSFRIIKDRNDIASIKREIRRSYSGLFPSDKRITDENYQLKAHLREARQREEMMGSVKVLEFLLNLSQIRPSGLVFNEIDLSIDGLSLKGEASSMNEINDLKARLSAVLTEDGINASDLKPTAGGRIGFTISGRIKR